MRRTLGISAGVLTHALFALTFWRLVPFLWGSAPHVVGSLGIDVFLAAQFGVIHSVLLHPATRKRLERVHFVAVLRTVFLRPHLSDAAADDGLLA